MWVLSRTNLNSSMRKHGTRQLRHDCEGSQGPEPATCALSQSCVLLFGSTVPALYSIEVLAFLVPGCASSISILTPLTLQFVTLVGRKPRNNKTEPVYTALSSGVHEDIGYTNHLFDKIFVVA